MAADEHPDQDQTGVGPTQELSLRVSVGVLARVVFDHPQNGQPMLALERKATLVRKGSSDRVLVRAQPFGGAVRLLVAGALSAVIGNWHFDSQRSRAEQDMRIFIQPTAWQALRQLCLGQLTQAEAGVFESAPDRELAEEFADALNLQLSPEQYTRRTLGIVEERAPVPTDNIHAAGYATARLYRIDEVAIIDRDLVLAVLANSRGVTNQDLTERVLKDARSGGRGRANAVLALPMETVRAQYRTMPGSMRYHPVAMDGNILDGNVQTLFTGELDGTR